MPESEVACPAGSPDWGLGLAEAPGPVPWGYIGQAVRVRPGPSDTFTVEIEPNFTSFWGKLGALGIFVFAGL